MNDPHVVALIYRVAHRKSVHYDNAGPLRYSDAPEFELTVEDNTARFEFKTHYASKGEALEAVEPFIDHWEFEASMRFGPGNFELGFKEAEIIDRNPSPPEPRKEGFGASAVPPVLNVGGSAVFSGLTASGGVAFGSPRYPPPPGGGSVDLKDPCVVKMQSKYNKYCLGRVEQPAMAYFFVDALEEKYGDLAAAAKACGVSRGVLKEIKALSSYKGGEASRKADGFDKEFTREEKRFLNLAIPKIILRVAQVAADNSQRHPKITKGNLTSF